MSLPASPIPSNAPAPVAWSIDDAFRRSSAALALIGFDGRWLELNAAAARLFGRPRTSLVGRPLQADCELADALGLVDRIEQVLRDGIPAFGLELRIPRLDGSRTRLRLDASVVRGRGGSGPAYLCASLTDVTAEHRMREERDAFFDLSADPLAIAAPDGRLLRVNAAWTALLGWTSSDMAERPLLDFVHPDDRTRTLAEQQAAFDGQPTPRFRNRYRSRGGHYRWLEWHSRRGDDGRLYCTARDVTEQQQALLIFEAEMQRRRQALDEAEQRLGVHVNNTPLAVVEFDERLRVRRWSTRAEALFGWPEEQVVGDRPDQWRFIHEADADNVATAMLSLVTGETPSQVIRNRNHTRDGATVHCEWFMSAVFDDEGRLLSILAFAQDITARVAAEAESAEREALFRATFEQAPVGIAHVGIDGRWLRVNDTLCRLLGRDAATLMSLTFQDITHPDDLESDLDRLDDLLAGRIQRYEMRKRYLRPDGHDVWAQLTVSLRRADDGTPLHFISVVEDIVDTVQAELSLRAAHSMLETRVAERTQALAQANRTLAVEVEQRREIEIALRDNELRMRSILENSHDAFVASDEAGRVVEWNRAAEAIFGWRRSEALGRSMSELIIPPALREAHERGMARFITGSVASRVLDQRLQLPARHRNGREFPVELTISLVTLGTRRLFTAFLHDISDRVAAEQQLRDSENRVRTITDNVPAMIAYVGPDLRYRFANEAYRAWFGHRGDAAGLHMREMLGAEQFPEAEPYLQRVLAGERVSFDRQTRAADGSMRYEHVTYVPDAASDAGTGACGFFIAAHDVTAHRRLADVMEARALADELTGLPNRAGWMRALDAGLGVAGATGAGVAVLFLDLDGFKQVNDVHGHEAGDTVLRVFAQRLRAAMGDGVVARLAGDEFVALLTDPHDARTLAERAARTVQASMAEPIDVGTARLRMHGSIGIAVQRAGPFAAARLVQAADAAMYDAKRETGGAYRVHELADEAVAIAAT
ncbi:sensor domain-containing protein [Lysobacter humi (ex Lee et al. 2017)]